MGINFFGSSSSYDKNNSQHIGNISSMPDPSNWFIKDHWQYDLYLLVWINYPDCTNYEGDKIMLYKNITLEMLEQQKLINPHFLQNTKYYSPIARFIPNIDGWAIAKKLIKALTGRL